MSKGDGSNLPSSATVGGRGVSGTARTFHWHRVPWADLFQEWARLRRRRLGGVRRDQLRLALRAQNTKERRQKEDARTREAHASSLLWAAMKSTLLTLAK